MAVLRDGKPMAGANVSLYRESPVNLESRIGRGAAAGPAREAMLAVNRPAAATGPDGVARFTDLLPGSYGLSAVEPGVPQRVGWPNRLEGAYATTQGLGVAAGREATFAIADPPSAVHRAVPGAPPGRHARDGSERFADVRAGGGVPGHLIAGAGRPGHRQPRLPLAGAVAH